MSVFETSTRVNANWKVSVLYISSLIILTFILFSAQVEADAVKELIHFKDGISEASVKGKIRGYRSVDYRFSAKAGQLVRVDFSPSNLSAYFNLLPPAEEEEALFVGSTSGNNFKARLEQDGVYTIRVYLMRNAARRNESSRYALKLNLSADAGGRSVLPTDNPNSP